MPIQPGAKSRALIFLLLAALLPLSACVPLLAVATVTAVDVSLDRRTPGRFLDDNALELKLRDMFVADETLGSDVNISVTAVNGVVLLTGEVNSDAQRQRAGKLAEASPETRKVVNELQLAGKTNISSRINDSWITTKIKAKLVKVENLSASLVKVVTEQGKVYLLGLVTRAEADAAVEAISTVKGVTHIVKVFEYIE